MHCNFTEHSERAFQKIRFTFGKLGAFQGVGTKLMLKVKASRTDDCVGTIFAGEKQNIAKFQSTHWHRFRFTPRIDLPNSLFNLHYFIAIRQVSANR